MRTLVTGGAGFIGCNLVRALLARGDQVRILDNLSTGQRANVAGLDVELIEGDLRSYERVNAATKGVEVVFHQGALPSVPRSVQDPLTSNAVNVDGTLNVLLASRDRGVRRVVVASSSSVYGNAPGTPRTEQGPIAPLAPYAVSKLAAEQYSLVAHHTHGLETVALRYFNVFGERQDPLSGYAAVIPKFTFMMLDGNRPTIFGNGSASRDFTYIENVVQANLAAAVADGASGRVFNVATGETRTINLLVRELNRLLGTDLEPEYLPPRPGEVSVSHADISAAAEVLGYRRLVTFEAGLERTVKWIAEHRSSGALSP
ncbi:MAG: NAD-dependent epimerase/dehydratase family protein [Solirubrobacterales bacterium]|nr:NAD-dependent epimerase/dehydratase family protein [Solirubrobacterales bacterium]